MNDASQTLPFTVLLWGTYDLGKPRTRILRTGLVEAGATVIEIHVDVWSRFEDKSQIGKFAFAITLLRLLLSYPILIYRYLRAPAHDVVLVPYLGQFDVIVLWPFARLRSKAVVWDMFLSLYDTVVNDRKMIRPRGPIARCLKGLEWLGCRAASRVLLDTKTHAAYISELFSLPQGHATAVPVGAEGAAFQRQKPPGRRTGATRVLFYGQLIPLHGIETILDAALSERGRKHSWHIIGKGQQTARVAQMLDAAAADHITHENWVAYESLAAAIADADICLGIFGSSRKAASVVPNKVYQCLAAGRTVISRQSPAMNEVFPDPHAGLILIPDADPNALLDAIDTARAADFPVVPEDAMTQMRAREIGQLLCDTVLAPVMRKPN